MFLAFPRAYCMQSKLHAILHSVSAFEVRFKLDGHQCPECRVVYSFDYIQFGSLVTLVFLVMFVYIMDKNNNITQHIMLCCMI